MSSRGALKSGVGSILSALVILVIVSAASGCGGGGGSSSTPPAVAPSISTQPQKQTVRAPATATFSVTATGTAPLSYQWNKNGAAISGAISATYTTPATTGADNGAKFSVLVTNSAGSVSSNSATLTVNVASISVSVSPANANVASGATLQFRASVANTTNQGVTWQVNGMSGGNVSVGTISDSGLYTAPGDAFQSDGGEGLSGVEGRSDQVRVRWGKHSRGAPDWGARGQRNRRVF